MPILSFHHRKCPWSQILERTESQQHDNTDTVYLCYQPTEQYNQDMVSLGLHSATTAGQMVPLLRDAIAILMLALSQSIDLRWRDGEKARLGKGTQEIYTTLRERVPFLESDRPMSKDIGLVGELIERRAFDLPVL